jgi:hypothetical protein
MRNPVNKTYYANQLIDNLIKAAEQCDPVAINDFFSLTIEANLEHLDVIQETISIQERAKRQNALVNGSIMLSLFNHFAYRKITDGLGLHVVSSD